MKTPIHSNHLLSRQRGATLIEALVAVLILALGLLAMGGMMAYAIQIPKMAGNRSVAVNIGMELIERMRTNTAAYKASNNAYTTSLTYDGSSDAPDPTLGVCSFPNCTAATLAAMDLAWAQRQLRLQLPAGGYSIETTPGSTAGNLWILWQEVGALGSFATSTSDICPATASSYTDPQPRCLLIPFRL
ncbi:MAG: type IV pilus modification protein PilV [Rhodoferax sp.]|nr:type IV pilus modification protein PilV [Rhodoferax sp.]